MRLPTILTVAVTAALAAACGSNSSFTAGGEKITNVDEVLAAVESEFRSDVATDDTVTVGDDARCYFLNTNESDVDLRAFCGPVGFYDAGGPFNVYWLQSYATEDGVELESGGRGESGVTVRDTTMLVRPDNEDLPDDLFVAPPGLASDAVLSVEQLPYDLSGGVDDTAWVRYPQSDGWGYETGEYDQIRIVALGRTPTIGDGYTQMSTADAHELVVVQLDHGTDADIAVLVDGNRRTIENIWARYHIISVPEGSDPVLEFRLDEVVQTLSLTDGARGGDGPALWYRDDVTGRIGHHLIRTYDGGGTDGDGDTYDFSVTLEATYTDVGLVGRDGDGMPAPSGKVWLTVGYENVRSFEDAPWRFEWSADVNPTLTLDDGTVIEPVNDQDSYGSGTLYFAVDDGFTTGTLKLSPDIAWELPGWDAIYDRGEASLDIEEVEIRLS